MVGVAYCICISGIRLDTFLSIYGSVFGFLFVIGMPVSLHFYCLFWTKQSGWVQEGADRNLEIMPNECHCRTSYRSLTTLYLETALLCLLTLFGITIMTYNIYQMIFP